MARTDAFGPVGIAVADGAGTGSNDKRMVLSAYKEAYLATAYIVVGTSSGPVWGLCVLRTAGVTGTALADPAWIRGDPNFGGSDYWFFGGKVGLSAQGGNELIPLLRNDSGAAVTVQVGGTLLIERD